MFSCEVTGIKNLLYAIKGVDTGEVRGPSFVCPLSSARDLAQLCPFPFLEPFRRRRRDRPTPRAEADEGQSKARGGPRGFL